MHERTPLLPPQDAESGVRSTIYDEPRPKAGKPLPKVQILLLCYARLMEAIAFFSVFPYVPEMIQRNADLSTDQIGFYSGLIESSSSIAEMAATGVWYYLADHVGRKPALVLSLVGMAAGPVLFGFSGSIAEMILARLLAGFFSGAGLIIRIMIGEHTTPETQATAYGWFSMTDSIGGILGPLLGGALADPARKYPTLFGGVAFFEQYPYALPGLVVGAVNASAVLSSLYLKETRCSETTPMDEESCESTEKESFFTRLAAIPGIGVVLWVYSQTWVLGSLFVSVLPVALYTKISLGGIGLSPYLISIYMGVQAASQALWFVVGFPLIQRRVGTKGVLRLCAVGWPALFTAFIIMNLLSREGSAVSVALFWVMACLSVSLGPAASMAYGAGQLVINEVSPDPRMLGTLNTVALMVCNLTRVIVPWAATAVYAAGVQHQVLLGNLGWVVFITVSAGLAISCRWLPDR